MSGHPAGRNWSLAEEDRRTHFHSATDLARHQTGETAAPVITGAHGSTLVEEDGREVLDGFGGLYCVNVGYGRQEIVDRIAAQGRELSYYHVFAGATNPAVVELSRRVLDWAPDHMARVFWGLSGSDANDTQVKIVRYYNNVLGRPAKKKIIARRLAYHGSGVISGSMTGIPVWHRLFDLPEDGFLHVSPAFHYGEAHPGESELDFSRRLAAELETLIVREGADTVAAFIGEPLMGTGGVIPPPEGYWDLIQAVLTKHAILLIADEVVTGFGRMGTRFGCDFYGIQPDLISIAKGLSSAYLPISGVIVSDRVWEVLLQGSAQHGVFGHGTTYGGHPLCASAALANLDIIEREELVERAADLGPYLLSCLSERLGDHPLVGDVRGAGLLAAVELGRSRERRQPWPDSTKVHQRASAHARTKGVIARAMPGGPVLGYAPPFVITRTEIEQLADVTASALDLVLDELAVEGLSE